MKYKIIKKFPCYQFFETVEDGVFNQDIVKVNSSGFAVIPGSDLKVVPELWPEYFEPVKEPLFTTYDGVEILEMKGYVYEVYRVNTCTRVRIDYYDKSDRDKFVSNADYKCFSTEKAANDWIDENKPIFSKKQISDAIGKAMKGIYELRGTYNPETRIDTVLFKQELGL